MKIRPRIFAYRLAPDPECVQMCKLYCLLMVEDPLVFVLCIAGCYALC